MPRSERPFVLDWTRVDKELSAEFEPADLGEERLDDRQQSIANRFGRTPGTSIPAACSD